MTRLPLIAALAGLTALSACQERDTILTGERLDPRAVLSPDGPVAIGAPAPTGTALSLPPVRGNSDWPQRAGSASHASGNMAIGAGTQRIWAATIGAASDRRHRITADPIVAAGMVFTLDSQSTATATTTGGGRVWSVDLRPAGESDRSVSGGGLAFEGNRVFVTTGYGELVALDARSGAVAWRQRVDAPIGGSPTAQNGVVYVLGRDATTWAVRASDGKVLWEGKSGADGLAKMPNLKLSRDERYMILARHGGDISAIYGERSGPYPPYANPMGRWEAHMLTQLPLYQPGQEVRFTLFAANVTSQDGEKRLDPADWRPMTKERLFVTVRDSQNREVWTGEAVTNAYGSISGSFPLSDAAPSGPYTAFVRAESMPSGASLSPFQVASFRPPDFKVDITAPASQPAPDGNGLIVMKRG